MRVANTYFTAENRAVALYYRQAGAAEDDPLLAGLDDQERQQVRQIQTLLAQANEEQLRQLQAQTEQMAGQAPPENQDMVAAIQQLVQERLDEVGGAR